VPKIPGKISARRLIRDHLPDRIFADGRKLSQRLRACFTGANPEIYEVSVDVNGHFGSIIDQLNPS
jgi:hypothetical protein